MITAHYSKAIDAAFKGQYDLTTDVVKLVLIDIADYGTAITGATNATPIVVTSVGHGLTTGDKIIIMGVGGNTAANNAHSVTVLDTDTFSLQDPDDNTDVAGSGAYTSGGYIVYIDSDEFLSDVPSGARVATSAALTGATFSRGVFDANDTAFIAATGDPSEAIISYIDTGVEGTSRLISIVGDITPNPVIPNTGDIDVQFNVAGIFSVAYWNKS